MRRLTTLSCVIICILHTPVSIVQAYCWEPGKNPYFTGPPIVEQVDLQTVRVSWLGLVEMRECADQFLVKYWPINDPQGYRLTKLVNPQVNNIDIKVSPRVEYQFQAIVREDKGSVTGVDWNKSDITDFKTSDDLETTAIVQAYWLQPMKDMGLLSMLFEILKWSFATFK